MGWTEWVTLGLALLGAGLGVFNTVSGHLRGRVALKLRVRVEPLRNGELALYVEVINAGRIAVTIEEVFLAAGRNLEPRSGGLRNASGHPVLPRELAGGKKLAIGPVHALTMKQVLVFEPITVVVATEDGRLVKARCPRLRELYAQMKTAGAGQGARDAAPQSGHAADGRKFG